MSRILLSIKPEYVKGILSGSKKYEYRKRLPQKEIDTIVIYSTSPISKVIGEVKVVGTISLSPSALWEKTKNSSGISRKKYREYFYKSKTAYAFILDDAIIYDSPKSINEYGLSNPPQSFLYLDQ